MMFIFLVFAASFSEVTLNNIISTESRNSYVMFQITQTLHCLKYNALLAYL